MINIYQATTADDYATAGLLFKEYAEFIHINLNFQHFEEELAGLKKMYSPPYGGILLARADDEIIGCVAIRKISDKTGELKRMFVKAGLQNKGAGRQLLDKAIQLAKDSNYSVLKLDTLSHMTAAVHLYRQAGFYETPPYYHNPLEEVVYFEKQL